MKITKSQAAAALGSAKSEAKSIAARANGAKGGRPLEVAYEIIDSAGNLATHLDTIRGLNVPFSRARAEKRAREMNKAHGTKMYSVREAA